MRKLVVLFAALAVLVGAGTASASSVSGIQSTVSGIQTPSGNIRCRNYAYEIVCQVINLRREVVIPTSGRAYTRPMARVITPHMYVLQYGQTMRIVGGGSFHSMFDGLEAHVRGHGFFANRDGITTW
jgi:hypothetical protein